MTTRNPHTAEAFSVLIPAYDETETIRSTLTELLQTLPRGCEVVVAAADSDGRSGRFSPTGRAASLVGDCRVRVCDGGGLTEAVRNAARHARHEVVVVMDADGQHDPRLVGDLVGGIEEGYDISVGETRRVDKYSWYRDVLTGLSIALTRLRMPLRTRGLRFPQSGFFATRRCLLVDAVERVNGRCYKVLVALLMSKRLKAVGVDTTIRPRTGGVSKLAWEVVWADLRLLLRKCRQ